MEEDPIKDAISACIATDRDFPMHNDDIIIIRNSRETLVLSLINTMRLGLYRSSLSYHDN